MKIFIAVPTFETIQPEVFRAIYGLESEHELYFDFIKGYDVAVARNKIAQKAKDGGYDYTFMVDSDTIVPSDALKLMLDPPEDIVLGVCPRKNTKEGKTAMIKMDSNGYQDSYCYSELPEGRTEVKAGGFACALVKTSVFYLLKNPLFSYAINRDQSTLSEDFYFCKQARAAGLKIHMDPRVRCGHLARYYQYE